MPTIVREGGFHVRMYGPPREHPPPHVHVVRRGNGEVVIDLGSDISNLLVREVRGMKDRYIVLAFRIVERHHGKLIDVWRALHDEIPD